MPACSAYGCKNRDRTSLVTFHRFPKNEEIRKKWIEATRRENFNPSKSAVLCSKHFVESDVDRTSISCVRIREGAVPNVFDAFPSRPKKETPKVKKPPLQLETPSLTQQHDDEPVSPENVTLKRKLEEYHKQLAVNRPLSKKSVTLQNVISELRKCDYLSTSSLYVLENFGDDDDFLKRRICKYGNTPLPVTYSAQLRSFASTLYFYSPQAYRFVRNTFDTCLPHPRTIENWHKAIDDRPKLTVTVSSVLKTGKESE